MVNRPPLLSLVTTHRGLWELATKGVLVRRCMLGCDVCHCMSLFRSGFMSAQRQQSRRRSLTTPDGFALSPRRAVFLDSIVRVSNGQ